MVAELREAIEEDWAEYAFLVCSTDDEHVVVRFELSTLDSEPGLGAYMNVFSRSHRCVPGDWNSAPSQNYRLQLLLLTSHVRMSAVPASC